MLEERLSQCLGSLRQGRTTEAGRLYNNRCLSSGPLTGFEKREPLYSAAFYPSVPLGECPSIEVTPAEFTSLTCHQCGAFPSPLCGNQGDEWVCVFCARVNSNAHSVGLREVLKSVISQEESCSKVSVVGSRGERLELEEAKLIRRSKTRGCVVFVVDCSSPHLKICLSAVAESVEKYASAQEDEHLGAALLTVRNGSISVSEFMVDSGMTVDVVSSFVLSHQEQPLHSLLSNIPNGSSYFCHLSLSNTRANFLRALKAVKPCHTQTQNQSQTQSQSQSQARFGSSFEAAIEVGKVLGERDLMKLNYAYTSTQIIALTSDEAVSSLTLSDLALPASAKVDLVVVAGSTGRVGKVELVRTLQGHFHFVQNNRSLISRRLTALLAKMNRIGSFITLRTSDSLVPFQVFGRVESPPDEETEQAGDHTDTEADADVLRFRHNPLGVEDAIFVLFDPEEVVGSQSEARYLQWVVEYEEQDRVTHEVSTLRVSEGASIKEQVLGVSIVKALSSRFLRGADPTDLATELKNFQTNCNKGDIITESTTTRLVEFGRWLTSVRYTLAQLSVLEHILRVGVEECMMALEPVEVRLCFRGNGTWMLVDSPDGSPSKDGVYVQDFGSFVQVFLPSSTNLQNREGEAVASVLQQKVGRDFVRIAVSRRGNGRQHPWFRS